ncbi:Nup53/35/40-type RNA recognition motif-domain-containing protein [Lipomyces arxii]|uniref:Nup53/35/40-type RNA recognition motif-domain-containing protein n=1 Tax=Lipomyces arxii TaxID=56418 RepID=UPI0034CE08E6
MSLFGNQTASQQSGGFLFGNNTPNQPSSNTTNTIPSLNLSFGNSTPNKPQQSNLFGSNTPSFGQQSQQQPQQQQPAMFGNSSTQQPAQSSLFSSPNVASSPFGQQQQQQQSTLNGNRGLTQSQSSFNLASPQQQLQAQQAQLLLQQQQSMQNQLAQQGQRGLQNQQVQSTSAYLMSSPTRAPPPTPQWATNGESRRYIPSHLTHMRYKNSPLNSPEPYSAQNSPGFSGNRSPSMSGYQQPMSPYGTMPPRTGPSTPITSSPSMSRLRNKTASSSQKFGGQSFGVPKPHHTRLSLAQNSVSGNQSSFNAEFDDLPPTESIYDSGTASPFAFQLPSTVSSTNNLALPAPSVETPSNIQDSWQPTSPGTPYANTKRQSTEQPTSVIVFGFPDHMSHAVIDKFSKFGPIMEHYTGLDSDKEAAGSVPVIMGKNWMRVTYTTPAAASRALAENGKTLGAGDYIIGCRASTPSDEIELMSPAKTPGSLRRSAGIRGSESSLGIHGLLDGGEEASSSYASTISRRRKGEDANETYLFTPQQGQPQQQQQSQQQSYFSPAPGQSPEKSTSLPRTTSMPAGLGRRIDLKRSDGIFKEKERRGITGSATLRGLASILMGSGDDKGGVKEGVVENGAKRLRTGSSSQSWLGWTSKKAQDFIFGWDDL